MASSDTSRPDNTKNGISDIDELRCCLYAYQVEYAGKDCEAEHPCNGKVWCPHYAADGGCLAFMRKSKTPKMAAVPSTYCYFVPQVHFLLVRT